MRQAAEKLVLGSPVAGRPYFITNDEPRPFWEFLGDICEVPPTPYLCSICCCCELLLYLKTAHCCREEFTLTAVCIVLRQGLDYGRPRIKLPFGLIFFLACIFEYLVGRSVIIEVTSEMALAIDADFEDLCKCGRMSVDSLIFAIAGPATVQTGGPSTCGIRVHTQPNQDCCQQSTLQHIACKE